MQNSISRRHFLAALAVAVFAVSPLRPVLAHEANCPYCAFAVVQDTDTQDNEVKLRYGKKRIEYRCVFCALSEAQSEYTEGDVVIAAPSEKKGEPVVIKRTAGKWSTAAGVLFAAQQATHKVCQTTYRAFHARQGFDAWVKAHPERFASNAKPLTLDQMLEVSKSKK